jgi:hypothetical protein
MTTSGPNPPQAVPVVVLAIGGAMASEDVEMDVYRLLPQNPEDIRVRNCRRLCGAAPFATIGSRGWHWINWPGAIAGLAVRGFITPWDARRIRHEIRETLRPDDPESLRRSLLLVGKSAGGISLWNTLRLHYDEITGWVVRCALVLIDPHGNAWGDDVGSYSAGQNLTCPRNWSTDHSRFRIYNIFQQRFPGVGGHLTGASFPGAFLNEQLFDMRPRDEGGLYHMTMMQHPRVHDFIRKGYMFARTGG